MNRMIPAAAALTLLSCIAPFVPATDPAASAPDAAADTRTIGSTPASSTVLRPTLTLAGASRVLDAAVAFARQREAGGAIAVVDDGGHLVALQRLDGTFAAGAEVSTGKARTAALFRKPTKAFEDAIHGGRIALTAVPSMTPLQGGIPLVVDGHVIGAIGVSGAHSQVEDDEIALAGAAALTAPAGSDRR